MSRVILKLEKVNKHYRDKKRDLHIINDLELEVEEGEFIAIMGKSGSGKSTLLNLIGALDRPDSGSIYYDGKEINGFSETSLDSLRNEFLGFVFQFHYLLPEFSALENVMLPAMLAKKNDVEAIKKRAKELLEDVELGDRLHHKPAELSGGEKQRVAVARAMINSPKLILADEPTGNLDEETSENIHRLLKKINSEKKQTIVVVTHSSELAGICDKRFYLKKGRLSTSKD